jgi:hypothetical protein
MGGAQGSPQYVVREPGDAYDTASAGFETVRPANIQEIGRNAWGYYQLTELWWAATLGLVVLLAIAVLKAVAAVRAAAEARRHVITYELKACDEDYDSGEEDGNVYAPRAGAGAADDQ